MCARLIICSKSKLLLYKYISLQEEYIQLSSKLKYNGKTIHSRRYYLQNISLEGLVAFGEKGNMSKGTVCTISAK